ncbi:hypothetical protein [Bradyrhizobium cenepequi]
MKTIETFNRTKQELKNAVAMENQKVIWENVIDGSDRVSQWKPVETMKAEKAQYAPTPIAYSRSPASHTFSDFEGK